MPAPGPPSHTAMRLLARSEAATGSRVRLAVRTGALGDEQPAGLRSKQTRSAIDLSPLPPLLSHVALSAKHGMTATPAIHRGGHRVWSRCWYGFPAYAVRVTI